MREKVMTIGIVAPSFFIEKDSEFKSGINYLKECGFQLKYGDTVFERYYNTTGEAISRSKDINRMFLDSEVDIIMATDGGCRAEEIIELLDFEMIRNNPKPFCGFSDITHLLLALYTKTRNPVIHGIDIINGFGQKNSEQKKKNIECFWKTISEDKFYMNLKNTTVLKEGKGTGIAIGGWLNAVQHLAGTEYFPKNEKFVLFLEAIEEEPNRINMMLHSLRLAGIFENTVAMVIGKMSQCVEKEYYDCIPEIDTMFLDACDGYNFPIIKDAPFGHEEDKQAFKYGTVITIDTKEKENEIT